MSNNIKYFYIREKQPHQFKFSHPSDLNDPKHPFYHRGAPIACVAYQRRLDEDVSTAQSKWDLITYAVSVVNTEPNSETGKPDRFFKRAARGIASRRLTITRSTDTEKDRAFGFNIDSDASSTEAIKFIMDELKDYSWVPSRVRKAARKWIDGEE
jgi:hypothetical protein